MNPKTDAIKLRAQAAQRLLHNVERAEARECAGEQRLATHFPELKARLTRAMKATGARSTNAAMACRHLLCAEALVEVLEERVRDGRGKRGDAQGQIVAEYSARAAQKLGDFLKRPAAERKLIAQAYPEVDLRHVRRAHRHGLLPGEEIAGVLEDPINYAAMLRRLNRAELLRRA